MKILIVSCCIRNRWAGGVFKYYKEITEILEGWGHEVCFFDGDNLIEKQPSVARGIPFVLKGMFSKGFAEYYQNIKPDCVHIQTEFSVGVAARNFCVKEKIPFTSVYHTNLDLVVRDHNVPHFWVWPYLRWFYRPSEIIHTHTPRLKQFLCDKGIQSQIAVFPPGVDAKVFFHEKGTKFLHGYPRPYFVTMSRLSKEKNVEDFLKLDLPGTKFVVGEGPHKPYLRKKYGHKAVFLPYANVRGVLSEADVFVFPSCFDTFGMVVLEALACGLPIAAYPVMGAQDIVTDGVTGYISEDLASAACLALNLKKEACIDLAKQYTWEKTAEGFLKNQVLIKG